MRNFALHPPISLAAALLLLLGAVEARAGDDVEEATRRAIGFLEREVPAWPEENGCYSCHNNGDATRALFSAVSQGHKVDDAALADTREWLSQPSEWDHNGGDGEFVDPQLAELQFAFALAAGVRDAGLQADDALQRAAQMVAKWQTKDGSWQPEPLARIGSPVGYGPILATGMARELLRQADAARFAEHIHRAEAWLGKQQPVNVFEAGALLWVNADQMPAAEREAAIELLRTGQAPDGGWGPYVTSPAEPFDTAIALLGLSRVASTDGTREMIDRGAAFLAATQLEDGSWIETTRPPGAESYANRLSTAGWATLALLQTQAASGHGDSARRPNVVIILTDDQGYADISFNPHHPPEVETPAMDALAREGVFFTDGYISGPVCSPTRAGLMLGSYQQRVGVYTAGDGGRGFDPTTPIFPSFLPDEYISMAVGKWHLGLDEDYPELKWHPLSRGFDDCYIFMGRGAHDYFDLKDESQPIYRGKERIEDEGYLTHRLTEEAVDFIDRHQERPFFLYLAYNAVHYPQQAPAEDIAHFREKFPQLTEERAILMAMLKHLDDGVGAVVQKLKSDGLWDNTLLFFLTDNGGAKKMQANNAPLRGYKGSLSEGGIRTPFIVSWPAAIEGGRVMDEPVIAIDILPTVLDAVGAGALSKSEFDGRSLLPLLTGQSKAHHERLYWSVAPEGGEWAVRQGTWKAHSNGGRRVELFNLELDPSETTDVAAAHPQVVRELQEHYRRWIAQMPEPITEPDPPRDERETARKSESSAAPNDAKSRVRTADRRVEANCRCNEQTRKSA